MCQQCLDNGRVVCHRCKGTDFEVGSDSQLRSNEMLESSLTSSQGGNGGAEQEEHTRPEQIGELTSTTIEDEYEHPSWGCSTVTLREPAPGDAEPAMVEGPAIASMDAAEGTWMQVVPTGDWDSADYGEEYLSLQVADWLYVRPGLTEGWAYAFSERLGRCGWYPPDYARQVDDALWLHT